jgi:hypothetical protein
VNFFSLEIPERQWLVDHFFLEAVWGIFDDAVSRAREMVRTGVYNMETLGQRESDLQPYSLGVRDPQGNLEYWCVRVDRGVERIERGREEVLCGKARGAGMRG